jgi:hypothetical protein
LSLQIFLICLSVSLSLQIIYDFSGGISLSLSLLNFFGCNQKNPFSAIFSGAHFANHRYLIIDPQA